MSATPRGTPSERNAALGIWGAVSGSGVAAGVLLGRPAHELTRLVLDLLHERRRGTLLVAIL